MKNVINKFMAANLNKRVATAAALIPFVLAIMIWGGFPFTVALIAIACISSYEWHSFVGKKVKWQLVGVAYIAIPVACIIWLRNQPAGLIGILFLTSVVWATDIGAYFLGVFFGGPKIAPKISPKKTWAGTVGGLFCGVLVGILFELVLDHTLPINYIRIALILSLLAEIGDLLESYLKRYFNVKDSGTLLPGHGGFLDRIDSFTFAAPALCLYILMVGA